MARFDSCSHGCDCGKVHSAPVVSVAEILSTLSSAARALPSLKKDLKQAIKDLDTEEKKDDKKEGKSTSTKDLAFFLFASTFPVGIILLFTLALRCPECVHKIIN